MRILLTGGQVYRDGAFVLADVAVRKGTVEAVAAVGAVKASTDNADTDGAGRTSFVSSDRREIRT